MGGRGDLHEASKPSELIKLIEYKAIIKQNAPRKWKNEMYIFLLQSFILRCVGNLKGLAHAEIIKNRWFYFGFLIWPYDVNMSID